MLWTAMWLVEAVVLLLNSRVRVQYAMVLVQRDYTGA